jgi:hypothetical protein
MNRTPDGDAARLLAPLAAICGPEISIYRPKIEARVATLIANRRFVKPDSADRGAVMTSDISDEAKKAIADGARRRAADRLDRDGRRSTDAVQRRVRALATERNLAPADYAKLLHKRISMSGAVDFWEKHKVSLDWLLSGDLQGLQRMTQEAKAAPPVEKSDAYRDLLEAFGKLDSAGRRAIVSYLKTQTNG